MPGALNRTFDILRAGIYEDMKSSRLEIVLPKKQEHVILIYFSLVTYDSSLGAPRQALRMQLHEIGGV